MVEQRRKGRPASRGGKTRRSRSDAGRSRGAALGRGRGRRAEPVRPSPEWRRMRRVTERPETEETPPRRGRLGWLLERDR